MTHIITFWLSAYVAACIFNLARFAYCLHKVYGKCTINKKTLGTFVKRLHPKVVLLDWCWAMKEPELMLYCVRKVKAREDRQRAWQEKINARA